MNIFSNLLHGQIFVGLENQIYRRFLASPEIFGAMFAERERERERERVTVSVFYIDRSVFSKTCCDFSIVHPFKSQMPMDK